MNRTRIIKSIVASGLALAALTSPVGATNPTVSLDVRIDNVNTSGGQVRVAMFDERHWMSNTVVAATSVNADTPSLNVRLTAPRAGSYGLAVYQDLNRDGRLNRNIVDIPTEPVAFSNDARIRFGPPSFADAAVVVSDVGAATTVRLR